MVFKNKYRYEGSWKNGNRHGIVTGTFTNGHTRVDQWKNDLCYMIIKGHDKPSSDWFLTMTEYL